MKEKTLIKSINAISKEYDKNHERLVKARKEENTIEIWRFEKVEKHLREVNLVLKEYEMIKNGMEYFKPKLHL